jgi:hypothetical protein
MGGNKYLDRTYFSPTMGHTRGLGVLRDLPKIPRALPNGAHNFLNLLIRYFPAHCFRLGEADADGFAST